MTEIVSRGDGPSANPLVARLGAYLALTDDEKRILDGLIANKKRVTAGVELVRSGDEPKTIHLVVTGLLCRHKKCDGKAKQVLSYMIPGDFCDLYSYILDAADHYLVAMTDSVYVEITPAQIDKLVEHPRLKKALWWSTLVDASILREWIVNLGVRSAEKRIGHFFCEMMMRMQLVGLSDGKECRLPLTQTDLAETVGLSLVHTNKSLQKVKSQGLMTFYQGRLVIPDFAQLAEFSSFDPAYLHLQNRNADKGGPEAASGRRENKDQDRSG